MNPNEIAEIIMSGDGYFVIKNVVSEKDVNLMLRYIRKLTNIYDDHVLERRAWNLHKRHDVFMNIAKNNVVKNVYDIILGKNHKIGSFGANRLMPGSVGQEAHCDYPYWNLFKTDNFPKGFNNSFLLACQTLIPLQNLTKDNGATAFVPFSQKLCRYPSQDEFDKSYIQLEIQAGDILMYSSLIWHCAMPNKSNQDRTVLLGQYLSSFVENFKT